MKRKLRANTQRERAVLDIGREKIFGAIEIVNTMISTIMSKEATLLLFG